MSVAVVTHNGHDYAVHYDTDETTTVEQNGRELNVHFITRVVIDKIVRDDRKEMVMPESFFEVLGLRDLAIDISLR